MSTAFVVVALVSVLAARQLRSSTGAPVPAVTISDASNIETKFEFLSTHGNSNCSRAFLNSIPSMPDSAVLQGSCCSPMDVDRYRDQIESLKKYSYISMIPTDPYNISAGLAKRLLVYDAAITPTSDEQAILDSAVSQSDEKGYCCCACWRWSVYEGLSRYLVRYAGFNASQVTAVLNDSDGCGG